MRMHNPPHPGLTLRDDVLPALGLDVTAAAEQLGVSRVTLSRVIHGHAKISAEMALRLEKWLGVENGGRADLWLHQQADFDLWQAKLSKKSIIKKVKHVVVEDRESLAA
jgi:antitoxin HigA-1